MTKSTQDTMVNVQQMILLPLLASKYIKSKKESTGRCHQVNEGKSRLEAKRV